MIRSYELVYQANAVETRLKHLDSWGREDLVTYAEEARDATGNMGSLCKASLEFAACKDRADQQLQCEVKFPAGVRLGTFANSPVKLLNELRCGLPVTVPSTAPALEKWLREIVGKPDINNAQLRKWMGFKFSEVARLLAELFQSDPVSFFHLICFELDTNEATRAPCYPAVPRGRSKPCRPFHKPVPLVAIMQIIGEWRRVVQLVDELSAARTLHHVLFSKLAGDASPGSDDVGYDLFVRIMDGKPLPVPMLRVHLENSENLDAAMLREFNRLLDPQNLRGATKRRPLFHFYGLDALDTLLLGLLEVVGFARGVPSGTDPTNSQFGFGKDSLIAFAEAYSLRWPGLVEQANYDRIAKIRAQRTHYANTAGVLGNSFRFDPNCWSDREADAANLKHLSRVPAIPIDPGFYSTVARVRDELYRKFHDRFFVASRDLPIDFETRVAAHLMTGATVYTRDPTLLCLQEHALVVAGFRHKRARAYAKIPAISKPSGALEPWRCTINPTDVSRCAFPMLPRQGVRDLANEILSEDRHEPAQCSARDLEILTTTNTKGSLRIAGSRRQ